MATSPAPPSPAWSGLSPAPGPGPTSRRQAAVFVGRTAQLASAMEVVRERPAVLLVEGEAGVGKTRLVAELLDRPELGDRHRMVGRCLPLRDPLPLAPLVDAIRSLPDRPSLPLALAELLSPQAPPVPAGGASRGQSLRHLRFLNILDWLENLGPAVLVVEDLHWCDQQTGDLLRFLVPQLPPQLALVLTYRREDLSHSAQLLSAALSGPHRDRVHHGRVALKPLSPGETGDLARAILGPTEVSPSFVRYLHQRTAGLPFLIGEVIDLWADRPDVTAGGQWINWLPEIGDVPDSVRDLVWERVATLGPDARSLVEATSVLGVAASEALVIKAAGLTITRGRAALCEAMAKGVLVETRDGFDFRHPLARDAVYRAIPSPARRAVHLRAARLLDVPPRPAAQLARHYQMAGCQAQWLRFSEEAADDAAAHGDDSLATELLLPAVNSRELSGAARARLALKLAQACARSWVRTAACVEAIKRVIDEEENLPAGVRGELRLFCGALAQRNGQTTQGRAELKRCVTELRRRPPMAAKAMAWLAEPDVVGVSVAEHLRWLERAVRAVSEYDVGAKVDVLMAGAEVLLKVGHPDANDAVDALPWGSSAPELTPMLAWAAVGLSGLYFHAGEYQRGRRWLEEARRRTADLSCDGDQYSAAIAVHELLLDWGMGKWAGLPERARSHSLRCADIPRVAMAGPRISAYLSLARGEIEAAQRDLDAFFQQANDAGVLPALASGTALRCRILLAQQDSAAAADEAAHWLRIISDKDIWVWACELAPAAVEAMVAAGQHGEGRDLTMRFARGLRRRTTPLAASGLERCRAIVAEAEGRCDQAAHLWRRTQLAYSRLPRPHDAALAEARLGACLFDCDRPEGARHLARALAVLQELGASADASAVRRTMRARSIDLPHTGGRRAYGPLLSPREREVVAMARRHMTNAQIANELGLSQRTVEHHVLTAMRKLGLSSRRALPDIDAGD